MLHEDEAGRYGAVMGAPAEQQIDLCDMLAGMVAAEEAANRAVAGWSEVALDMIFEYGQQLGQFTIESIRLASGLPSPTSNKAWGGVVQSAARKGYIRRVGFAPSRSSNGLPMTLWELTGKPIETNETGEKA